MRFNGRYRCGEVANVESLTHSDPSSLSFNFSPPRRNRPSVCFK